MKNFQCKIVTWQEIVELSEILTEKIYESGYNVDTVIGLTRGGWIPARLVCDHLGIKNLFAIKTEHWGVTATRDGTARLAQPLSVDVRGQNVLVVDDITDTGLSLKLALENVWQYQPKNVKSALLMHITHSQIVPDFYAKEVSANNWTWFIFPWNYNEDLRTLITKSFEELSGGITLTQLKKMFQENYSINVEKDDLQKTLEILAKTAIVKEDNGVWVKNK